jgi:hypothetical protein
MVSLSASPLDGFLRQIITDNCVLLSKITVVDDKALGHHGLHSSSSSSTYSLESAWQQKQSESCSSTYPSDGSSRWESCPTRSADVMLKPNQEIKPRKACQMGPPKKPLRSRSDQKADTKNGLLVTPGYVKQRASSF